MDRQAILTASVTGLSKQNWVRAVDSGVCVYGNPDSPARCAIGVLLGNNSMRSRVGVDAIKGAMEGPELEDKLMLTDLLKIQTLEDWKFLEQLQQAHDYPAGASPSDVVENGPKVRQAMIALAKLHFLIFPEGF